MSNEANSTAIEELLHKLLTQYDIERCKNDLMGLGNVLFKCEQLVVELTKNKDRLSMQHKQALKDWIGTTTTPLRAFVIEIDLIEHVKQRFLERVEELMMVVSGIELEFVEKFHELKQTILHFDEELTKLTDLVSSHFKEFPREKPETRKKIERLKSKEKLQIAVFGSMKSGKSTLINKLIKADTLPVNARRATGRITKLVYGDKLAISVLGNTTEYDNFGKFVENLTNLISVPEKNLSDEELGAVMEVHFPSETLKYVEIWDIPGFNENPRIEEVCSKVLHQIDAILYLHAANVEMNHPENIKIISYINQMITSGENCAVMFILTKVDLLDQGDMACKSGHESKEQTIEACFNFFTQYCPIGKSHVNNPFFCTVGLTHRNYLNTFNELNHRLNRFGPFAINKLMLNILKLIEMRLEEVQLVISENPEYEMEKLNVLKVESQSLFLEINDLCDEKFRSLTGDLSRILEGEKDSIISEVVALQPPKDFYVYKRSFVEKIASHSLFSKEPYECYFFFKKLEQVVLTRINAKISQILEELNSDIAILIERHFVAAGLKGEFLQLWELVSAACSEGQLPTALKINAIFELLTLGTFALASLPAILGFAPAVPVVLLAAGVIGVAGFCVTLSFSTEEKRLKQWLSECYDQCFYNDKSIAQHTNTFTTGLKLSLREKCNQFHDIIQRKENIIKNNGTLPPQEKEEVVATFQQLYIDIQSVQSDIDLGDSFNKTNTKLGEGNSPVYAATINFGLEKVSVAAKEISRKLLKDGYREVKLLKKLRHPNIVRYYGCLKQKHDQKEIYYILQEKMEMDLKKFLHSRKVSLDHLRFDLLNILQPVAEAISCIHKNKVVHRDIHPRNILLNVTSQGNKISLVVKVADFGLSNYSACQSAKSFPVGHRGWMAPEMKNKGIPESPVDIWSFGKLIDKLLTRKYRKYQLNADTEYELLGDLQKDCCKEQPTRRKIIEEVLTDLEQILEGKKYI